MLPIYYWRYKPTYRRVIGLRNFFKNLSFLFITLVWTCVFWRYNLPCLIAIWTSEIFSKNFLKLISKIFQKFFCKIFSKIFSKNFFGICFKQLFLKFFPKIYSKTIFETFSKNFSKIFSWIYTAGFRPRYLFIGNVYYNSYLFGILRKGVRPLKKKLR